MTSRPARNAASSRSPEYERVLAEAERHAEQFDRPRLGAVPLTGLAVIACMDARVALDDILGLRPGDAHVIRNAGALATDDALRSLVLSQQLLGTEEILVIAHTECGLLGIDDEALRERLTARTGRRADMAFGGFDDLETNVRRQVARIVAHPWLRPGPVHGLIYEVETGRLREVG